MKKDSQTSICWDFFEKVGGSARCRECKRVVTCFGNTSNLMKHLRRIHKDVFNSYLDKRKESHEDSADGVETEIVTETVGNENITLNIVKATQESPQDKPVEFNFLTNVEGATPSEEETSEPVPEQSTAVHTIQAYRDVNGTTFLYLQPATEGEASVQIQNAQFQPVVASSESITANGEIVSVALKEPSAPEVIAADSEAQTQEEATPRRVVHAPVKNYQGSSAPSRASARQAHRPSPVKSSPPSNNNNNNNNNNYNNNSYKEDTYEAFGKYIASMLRNLPSKSACKLQGEIVNWILKEQIKNNS